MKSQVAKLAFALACMLACHALAGPKSEPPRQLPSYAPDKPLPVPQIEKKALANGLEVWVMHRSGVPRVNAVLAVRGAGLAADAPDATGFAALLADLLNDGTAKRNSQEIAEAAQGFGGSVHAIASADGISVVGDALPSEASQMLGLLAEIVRTANFPEDEVRLAQANARQRLEALEAQPDFKAERALAKAVYGVHPYARTTLSEGGIRALTQQALRQAHAARFRPDRALLVITGRMTPSQAMRAADVAFGGWLASGSTVPAAGPTVRTMPPTYVLINRPGSVQSSIRLGRPSIAATHADYIPLQLASSVLGGGFSSRLMQNLRQSKGYTYGARGGLDALLVGGRVSASADVRNEVTGAALKEFFVELRRMGDEPAPSQELEDTKRYVAGGYLISNQMQGAAAATLANNWLVGLPAEYLVQYLSEIRAVSAAQVQAMGRKYLDPNSMSVVVVGDSKAVAEQLKEHGAFPIRGR
jgi:zinc protease